METVKVTLTKQWSKHKAGSKIVVDEGRAEWLRKHGHLKPNSKPKK